MNNKAEYTPEKVVDISNLSREDWLEYRKKGIGGSDVAAIMGISPFATIRDLFYNKTGVQPVIQEEEESNSDRCNADRALCEHGRTWIFQ